MTYDLSTGWTIVLVIGVVWDLLWKGMAMWRAARLDQTAWFTALLIVNSVGILPIVYLLSHHAYRRERMVNKGAA